MKDTVIDFHVHLSEYESFGEDAFLILFKRFPLQRRIRRVL